MEKEKVKISALGKVLLETGALLMSSGANTNRIRLTVNRIASAFHYDAELLVTHRALMLSLADERKDKFYSSLKRTSPHGVNFRLVSGISHMSWKIVEEGWTIDQIQTELDRLKELPHYPRLVILTFVSLAGASFCHLFGGAYVDMAITFVATFAGLFVRQQATKMRFNPYLCIFFASLVSTMLSGLAVKYGFGENPEAAFSTSVLYLVPGVPLINSFTDLLDGNIMNGMVRGANGLIITLSIALGLLVSLFIYQI
ncbi:MAG TPA: threonine/serine exporter family protein [Prolixibacteraceae bacterium]|nr:threonine/serine exporter family protein [Prolixibacteraceae bacterium]